MLVPQDTQFAYLECVYEMQGHSMFMIRTNKCRTNKLFFIVYVNEIKVV